MAEVEFELSNREIEMIQADNEAEIHTLVKGKQVLRKDVDDQTFHEFENSNVRDLLYGCCRFLASECLAELLRSYVIFEEETIRNSNLDLNPDALYLFIFVNDNDDIVNKRRMAECLWELAEADPITEQPDPLANISKYWNAFAENRNLSKEVVADCPVCAWFRETTDEIISDFPHLQFDLCKEAVKIGSYPIFELTLQTDYVISPNQDFVRFVFTNGTKDMISHMISIKMYHKK